jgi:cholesterol transport system auxiliary component
MKTNGTYFSFGPDKSFAINLVASCARFMCATAIYPLVFSTLLAGCALPERGPNPVLYDFGERTASAATVPSSAQAASPARPALAITVHAATTLESTALLYRLAFDDARQLRTYALARWAVLPADLVQQRLREGLSRQRTVLRPGQGATLMLALELEEFSQVFDKPGQSAGVLRLRATLQQASAKGFKTLAQRSVSVQRPAPTAGASGGVRALEAATDAAVAELAQWLQTLAP